MPHYAPARFLNETVHIDLVGCGGNGSQMLTGLARLNHAIKALGHPGLQVTVHDPDTVSEANMGRQMFSPADVGLFKAVVLAHRINAFFGLNWTARPHRFLEPDYRTQFVICCVDSAHARGSIASYMNRSSAYYMDLGNRAADGQVVLGTWKPIRHDKALPDHVSLPNPYDLFPELTDTSVPEDDTPSCGLAEALERQELFINQAVVTPALQILWEFFRHGRLTWHGAFVNLRTGNMRPIPVREATSA